MKSDEVFICAYKILGVKLLNIVIIIILLFSLLIMENKTQNKINTFC